MLHAQRLVALRKAKGLYQKDVASAFGLERTTYAKYETRGIQPPNDMVVKLANFFGVSTDYLLGISDNPNPESEPDSELWELRREMAERSEMKTLFSLAKTADRETIEFANELIKRMRKESGYTDE